MRLSFLIFSLSCHHVFQLVFGDEITLTRHADGDVFITPGSCNEACMVLSSDTASPYGFAPPTLTSIDNSCKCQCNYGLPVFREDLQICVDDIQECEEAASFVSSSGLVEKVPYVFLPQCGQIIYPEAEIRFKGVEYPLCTITGVQQLSRSGWSELRNISDVQFPLSFYRDRDRTFLQWTGEAKLREAAEGKIVVVKLACRDSYPATAYRKVFTSCVAFRVAGSPTRSSIKEVFFASDLEVPQGLSRAEYTAIAVSSVLLALLYLASVLLYLHIRRSRRRKDACEKRQRRESGSGHLHSIDVEVPGIIKCNPLLAVHRHFESDSSSVVSEAEPPCNVQSESESDIENITSALIHPREHYVESQEQYYNSGSIVAEKLPEADVRIVETTENGNQQNVSVFPGTQRRKLYFNPAYFEKQLLLAPPPAAIEFLLKIREVITIAKHKMAAKRFVPTLGEIPEETTSERQSSTTARSSRRGSSSLRNEALVASLRSLRCTGCPGCNHGSSTPNLPTTRSLAETSAGAISGESRVRAWLEDVKLIDERWRNLEDDRNQTQLANKPRKQQQKRFTKLRDSKDVDTESSKLSSKSLPPLFGELPQNSLHRACGNVIFTSDKHNCFVSKRTTRSVTHEPGYFDRQADEIAEWARRSAREHEENFVNACVRRTIEDSFKKQLEHLKGARRKKSSTERHDAVPKYNTKTKLRSTIDDRRFDQTKLDAPGSSKSNNTQDTHVFVDIINGERSKKISRNTKRIMDTVIREFAVTKEIEKEKEKDRDVSTRISDYETDSLEKTRTSKKSSKSPVSTEKSSQTMSTTLPLEEELVMRNGIVNVQISKSMPTKTNQHTINENHNLPEVVPLQPENYTLVSEVYVNDAYASPERSDEDSGPEIQYGQKNPGHLTIKVIDSPKNYIKQNESEYEPDTLDRKSMKLKVNDDIVYNKDITNEVFVDSLERSSQIMLRNKRSFKKDSDATSEPPHEYNSLREIYEARIKYQQQQASSVHKEVKMFPSDVWRNKNCKQQSSLQSRYERRQRNADNQPDVVPKPPPPPPPLPPPPELKAIGQNAKNARDRSLAGAGNPTTCEDASVTEKLVHVGKSLINVRKTKERDLIESSTKRDEASQTTKLKIKTCSDKNCILTASEAMTTPQSISTTNEPKSEKRQQNRRFSKWRSNSGTAYHNNQFPNHVKIRQRTYYKSRQHPEKKIASTVINMEDSAYVSSPDSSDSQRRLLCDCGQTNSTCTESDESTSGNGANSESGAESIETDSVFFGNFRNYQKREKLANTISGRSGIDHQQQQQKQQQRPINFEAFQIKSRVY